MAKTFRDHLSAIGYMLDVFEQSPDRKMPILASPDYARMKAEESSAFEKGMRALASAGHVEIRMQKRPDEHLIDKVILKDAAGLYAWMGRKPRRDLAMRVWEEILGNNPENPDWLLAESRSAVEAWSCHKPWRGIHLEQSKDAALAAKLALALVDGTDPGTSYKIFSARHADDSKALKRLELVVGGMLRQARSLPLAKPGEEPLGFLGISSYPDPVFLRGPFLAGRRGLADLRDFEPYAAVGPGSAGTIRWNGQAPYVLTIENKASFNAYVRNVQDDGVVLFTGGFPSSAVVAALKSIAGGSGGEPWYHWGDIDGGGLAIFRHLETEICLPAGITLHPHLMNEQLAEEMGQKARRDLRVLREIAESLSYVSGLARYLLDGGNILEQEVITPVAPVPYRPNGER